MSPILLIIGLFSSIVAYHERNQKPLEADPTEINHWQSTQISKETLLNFINNKNCLLDDSLTLACAYSVRYGLNNVGADLTEKLEIVRVPNSEIKFQKIMLQEMRKWNLSKLDFEVLINQMLLKINPYSLKAFYANAINGYLQVTEDPHTRIEPITINGKDTAASLKSGDIPLNKTIELNDNQILVRKFELGGCELFKKKLKEFIDSNNQKGLEIDLRWDRGGYTHEATCIASLFTGPGPLLVSKDFDSFGRISDDSFVTIDYGREKKIYDKHIKVLMNQYTASSAEILAGILQKQGIATLVGEESFGKGTYQQVVLTDKILNPTLNVYYWKTRGYFFFTDGEGIQGSGLVPDEKVQYTKGPSKREKDIYENARKIIKYIDLN